MTLEKHGFTHINSDTQDKDLTTTEARAIVNMQPSRKGHAVGTRKEIISGTSLLSNINLQSGSTVIGSIEDKENRLLYYFVHKEGVVDINGNYIEGRHYIFEIDGVAETVSTIYNNSHLFFKLDKPVSGVVVDGMLIFTDNSNPIRYINIKHAKDDLYTGTEEEINYNKPAPLYARWGISTTIAPMSRTSKDGYKFSYRIVYFDDSKSRLAHFSILYTSDLSWEVIDESNSIKVTAFLPSIPMSMIKAVEYILQRNNDPNFEIFETIKVKDITDLMPIATLNDNNTTTFLPSADVVQTYENIPRKSTTVELKDNRVFIAGGESGYDDNGVDLNLNLSVIDSSIPKKTVKNGGHYTVGISYEDKWGWKSPALAEKSISIPHSAIDSYSDRRKLGISISGTAPLWAVRYNIMLKEEGAFEIYQTFPAYVLPAMKESHIDDVGKTENFTYIGTWQYRIKGQNDAEGPRSIHLKIPTNIPFVPEKGMKLRFRDGDIVGTSLDVEYNIDKVVGDKMYIDNGGQPTLWKSYDHSFRTVEVYRKQVVQNVLFHEVAVRGEVVAGVHSTTSTEWGGDQFLVPTYVFPRLNFIFSPDIEQILNSESDLYGNDTTFDLPISDIVETPAYSVGSEEITLETSAVAGQRQLFSNETPVEAKPVQTLSGYSLNYVNIDNDLSSFVAIKADSKFVNNEDVVLYSDIYTPGSLVNGLFNVGLLSEYRLGVESGKIIRLEDVGENTILSIHENTCNSLYIGRNVMKTGDSADVISLTNDVIGYHRRLKSQFGTQDVGSISEIDGNVFFFDRYRRELVRYGNNGLVPLLAEAGVSKYYEDIIASYNLSGNSYQIRTAYYREHKQLFISFIGDTNHSSVYDERYKKVTDFYTAYPEWAASFGIKLVLFKEGNAWLWNEGMINMFFTDNYEPSITFIVNSNAEIDWLYTNFVLNSTKKWRLDISTEDGESFTYEDELVERENNKYYGNIYRDTSDSGKFPSGSAPRFTGAPLVGQTATVTLSRADAEYVEITEILIDKKERRGSIVNR